MSFDKKINDQINRVERINKTINHDKKSLRYLEQEGDGYLIPENEYEKTLKVTQEQMKESLPKFNRDNIFDLSLNYGSYKNDVTRNGRYILLGGQKGHIALLDWRNKDLLCELKTNEKIYDVKFLQNETMFATAQYKRVYIYDRQGIELHSLDSLNNPHFLEYLPYHYLLVTGLKNNYIKYLDVSMGKIISEIKTKSAEISCMTQNTFNSIIVTGHSNGTVSFYSPNLPDPAVKILSHPGWINSIAVDNSGSYMVTTGNDSKMRVWDVRTYKQLYEYYNPIPASSITISQKGLLSVGYGNKIEVWKDYEKLKQKEPYMKHNFANNQTKVNNIKFINFEDYLSIGTNLGYSQILIPGSGEANFDTFENNPFQTKKQRQNSEIRGLLEKIPAEMITLDPSQIGKIDNRSKSVIDKERQEEIKKKTDEIIKNQKKKLKKRLKHKETHELILKDFNKNQATRNKLRSIMQLKSEKKLKEKEFIKSDVKVLKMLQDDFDPELYIDETEEIDKYN